MPADSYWQVIFEPDLSLFGPNTHNTVRPVILHDPNPFCFNFLPLCGLRLCGSGHCRPNEVKIHGYKNCWLGIPGYCSLVSACKGSSILATFLDNRTVFYIVKANVKNRHVAHSLLDSLGVR